MASLNKFRSKNVLNQAYNYTVGSKITGNAQTILKKYKQCNSRNSNYQREKYCDLMFQWNPPKSYNYLIQNTFHQNQGFIINGTPDLVLISTITGKDNSMESFPIMFDKVKEHIWRDFGPFLYADPF